MEQLRSCWGAGLTIQESQVQKHSVAPWPTQPFILPTSMKWVPGTLGSLVAPHSGSSVFVSWTLSLKIRIYFFLKKVWFFSGFPSIGKSWLFSSISDSTVRQYYFCAVLVVFVIISDMFIWEYIWSWCFGWCLWLSWVDSVWTWSIYLIESISPSLSLHYGFHLLVLL